jgi:hypothetical protein
MKDQLDNIYGAKVFGKPSIQLDPLENTRLTSEQKLSERQTVINTYLPERFHVKNNQTNTNKSNNRQTLKEKHISKGTSTSMITFLESYFQTNRMEAFENVDEILEDMYAFLKENQG